MVLVYQLFPPQTKADGGEDDVYLTMKEISRLELDADFVNLSACETGLGALYGGEAPLHP